MKYHPEQSADEIYMGNVDPNKFPNSLWRTGRLGAVPRGTGMSPLDLSSSTRLRPWFIKVAEVDAAIEAARVSGLPERAVTIRPLSQLRDARTAFPEG